ncbi:MAG: hypothetical protein WCK51_05315 [Armatimonadota bacterium]
MLVSTLLPVIIATASVTFKLMWRIENSESPFYSISSVSKSGSLYGLEGYSSLHDGWTQPVWYQSGKRVKQAFSIPACSLPSGQPISKNDQLFKDFPTGGPTDCTWAVSGRRYSLKPGVDICQLTYEGGAQNFSQVVVQVSRRKAKQLSSVVPGLKEFATANIIHIDRKGWMVVGGFKGSFYSSDNLYHIGAIGEQLYWISFN